MKARLRLALMLTAVGALLPVLARTGADELEVYEGHSSQFVLSLPEGWFAFDQMAQLFGGESATDKVIFGGRNDTLVISAGKSDTGVVIFSPVNLSEIILKAPIEQQAEVMLKISRGETPNFFVDRGPAGRGINCTKVSKGARTRIFRMLKSDSLWSKDNTVVDDLTMTEAPVGGCQGLQFRGSTRERNGTVWVMDVQAVSDGEILYLFSLRAERLYFDKDFAAYEASLATLRLAAAE